MMRASVPAAGMSSTRMAAAKVPAAEMAAGMATSEVSTAGVSSTEMAASEAVLLGHLSAAKSAVVESPR